MATKWKKRDLIMRMQYEIWKNVATDGEAHPHYDIDRTSYREGFESGIAYAIQKMAEVIGWEQAE